MGDKLKEWTLEKIFKNLGTIRINKFQKTESDYICMYFISSWFVTTLENNGHNIFFKNQSKLSLSQKLPKFLA